MLLKCVNSELSATDCGIQKVDFPASYNPPSHGYQIADTSKLLPVHFQVATPGSANDVVRWMDDDIAHWDLMSWHFKWLQKHLHGDMKAFHCIDMGGNHGFYSYYLARLNCTVEMFEVQRELIEAEKNSVFLNHMEHEVLIHQLGVSDADSNMHIDGGGGTAFLTDKPTASSYTVAVTSADKCLFHRPKHYSFIKIDVEGFEVRALHGLAETVEKTVIEAFLIEIGPGRWDRAGLDVPQGTSIINSVLASKFLCYIIVRNSDSCPAGAYPKVSEHDILLSGASYLRYLPWSEFLDVMTKMASKDFDCNFLFLRHSHSFVERLSAEPYQNNMEGKFLIGGGKTIFFLDKGVRRAVPNWDTYIDLQKTQKTDVLLRLSDSKLVGIPEGSMMPSV
jgi:FkbM family methyltransferase